MTRLLNEKMQFWGYRRQDGRVGVRNHVLILPTAMLYAGYKFSLWDLDRLHPNGMNQ